MAFIRLLLCLCLVKAAIAKGSEARIECTPEVMTVTVPMDGDRRISYLDQLRKYKPCQPEVDGTTAMFVLDLQDPHQCGVTRVLNKVTGKRTFYHKIIIEDDNGGREVISVTCMVPGKQRVSRDVHPFPLDFDEPDVLNITRYEEGKAPEPVLGAIVKQNGKQVSGEISVTPGTPLTMEIFLNKQSAPIYGLLVNYMHVTDTGKQQETIILNGCSVDPYLFDNFVTSDGDTLTAKFKAFKFPDTTYVQFKGTVTVCLDKCQGVQCSNGQVAYGRRRRSIASSESNKLYEVSLTTFIQVAPEKGQQEPEDVLALIRNLKIANQRLGDMDGTPATVAEHTSDNKLVIHAPEPTESNSNMTVYSSLLLITCLLALFK
ncbi:zona pelucida superfamily protein qsm [Anticarsia gemmatalis]|uniref:zona pelucida superfamily protein qsm n=1 Tax=Anticarsia gemmatalis TaxID=129554 RepID=UPI003F75B570